MLQVDCLQLEELDNVVQDGEHDNGNDVAESVPHLNILNLSVSKYLKISIIIIQNYIYYTISKY